MSTSLLSSKLSSETSGCSATDSSVPSMLTSKSAILFESNTGKVLYEDNPDEKLPPASITKIMTLLLIYEAEKATLHHGSIYK